MTDDELAIAHRRALIARLDTGPGADDAIIYAGDSEPSVPALTLYRDAVGIWLEVTAAPCEWCAIWIGPHQHRLHEDGTLGNVVRRGTISAP